MRKRKKHTINIIVIDSIDVFIFLIYLNTLMVYFKIYPDELSPEALKSSDSISQNFFLSSKTFSLTLFASRAKKM